MLRDSVHAQHAFLSARHIPFMAGVKDVAEFVSCYSALTNWGIYTRHNVCRSCGRVYGLRRLPSAALLRLLCGPADYGPSGS